MTRLVAVLFALALATVTASAAFAGNSDTITIYYEVRAVNEVDIDDASVTLTLNSATAESSPGRASDTATFDITADWAANDNKITAEAAAGRANAANSVDLSVRVADQSYVMVVEEGEDVVAKEVPWTTGIGSGPDEKGLSLNAEDSVDGSAAGVYTWTVTFTVTDA
jgi:hypothetical protein